MIPLRTRAFLACRMLSHRSLAMPPPSAQLLTSYMRHHMLLVLSNTFIIDACCSVAIVNSHKPLTPSHRVQR